METANNLDKEVKSDYNKTKTVLFISESIPSEGFGSPVIFYRHLRRLENNGWKVCVMLPETNAKDASLPATWQVHGLPVRRWWLPPFRQNKLFMGARYWTMLLQAKRFIKDNQPAVLIGYLWGSYLSGFAAYVSKKMNIPLGSFLHDDETLFQKDSKRIGELKAMNDTIVEQCSVVWTVSDRLTINPDKYAQKHQVLLPIPEGGSREAPWKRTYASAPVIAYPGTYYDEHLVLFEQIAKVLQPLHGTLEVITKDLKQLEKLTARYSNVKAIPALPPKEALVYLNNRATAILVGYPERNEAMPWTVSCFPSKFVEYAHTGLPLLAIAPSNTAFAKWCKKYNWLSFTDQYDEETIRLWVQLIINKESWTALADQSIQMARSTFNPVTIQSHFEKDLKRLF